MAYKKVTLKNSEDYSGKAVLDHGVTSFHNGTAIVPEETVKSMKDRGMDLSVEDFDPEKDNESLTNYYYYRMEGHDAAKEKENLSLDNVADAHRLAPADHPEIAGPETLGRTSTNNWDSTVKIVPNLESPRLVPDDELYRGVPVTTASKKVEKRLDKRGDLARKHAKAVRDAYEGSNPARDEALERGTLVRAPLDNLRAANPAQKEALKENAEAAELVEMGADEIAQKNSDEADEKYGGVDRETKAKNQKKFGNKLSDETERAESGS